MISIFTTGKVQNSNYSAPNILIYSSECGLCYIPITYWMNGVRLHMKWASEHIKINDSDTECD